MATAPTQGQPLGVAIAGLGTVGAGVVKILTASGAVLAARGGRPIEIRGISARQRDRTRDIDIAPYPWFDNCLDLADQNDIEVVVELIGGEDGPAKALVERALANGKHVVTANKALIAHHGGALAHIAEPQGVTLAYEAAVAGGIPIIKGLREGLAANRVDRIAAILNGTCNFVLGLMEEEGMAFDAAVARAQEVGFAEADPRMDIGGIDAAHKLAILASIAFGTEIDFGAVQTTGIEAISADDIRAARELAYRIKLLAVATRHKHGCSQRVAPALVPLAHPLAPVSGPGNAVHLEGDWVGAVEFGGPGAGQGPTASAVVADIVDIARGMTVPTFGIPAAALARARHVDEEQAHSAFYLRFQMADEKGIIAAMTRLLADQDISIETMIQRPESGHVPGATMPVVVITYPTEAKALWTAVRAVEGAGILAAAPHVIRVESL